MQKTYVLDTNVLIHDPHSVFKFDDNNIVIPIVVIEELDKLKKGTNETARNAREAGRVLDALRSRGKLSEKVPLDGGGTLRVELNHQEQKALPPVLSLKSNDNRILSVTRHLNKKEGRKVVLVTKDTHLRIKADALDIETQDFRNDKIEIKKLYNGFLGRGRVLSNGFFKNESGELRRALSVNREDSKAVEPQTKVLELTARNEQQSCAIDLLRDDKVPLVAIVGKSGAGKTLLSVAVGLEGVKKEKYKKLVITKPIVSIGRESVYLSGTTMEPWMKGVWDALESLGVERGKGMGSLPIEVEPLHYLRGRSMSSQYLIIDEAQNLTLKEIKGIVTRAGEGSKFVFTGDPYQIDHPYLDSDSNGLSHLVESFKGDEEFGTVTLTKGERSRIAEKASAIL